MVGIGTTNVVAVTTNDTSLWKDVTNDNCEVVAYNGYTLHADDMGINVTWKGYDGNEYHTETVDWNTLKANNYSFEISDYFGEVTADNKLYDTSGNPVFTRKISFSPRQGATQADIIACIDGATISSSVDSGMNMRFEDGKNTYSGVSVSSSDLSFSAAYVSNQKADDSNTSTTPFTFDAATDTFMEAADNNGAILTSGNTNGNLIGIPSATKNLSSTISEADVEAAKNCNEGWTFSFYMEGLGKVTAKSSSLVYYSNDAGYYREADKNLWWYEVKNSNGGYTKYAKGHSASGTLSGVMSALTGDRNSGTLGLLTADKGGCADTGGYINLSFSLNADNAFSSGSVSGQKSVGGFTLRINVSSSDTEESVLKKISNALNENTLLDAYTSNGSRTYGEHYFSKPYLKQHYIQVPVYQTAKRDKVFLDVHGGAGAKC